MSADKRRQARTQGRYSFPPDKKSHSGNGSNRIAPSQGRYQYKENNGQNSFVPPYEEKEPKVEIINANGTWMTLSGEGDQVSRIFYDPDFITKERTKTVFETLKTKIPWQHKQLTTDEGLKPLPRLVAWYGPLNYKYSSVVMESNCEWPDLVNDIKEAVESKLEETMGVSIRFNSVLLNMYRDGKDSVAWHSDDELSMGVHPTIASVSLGTTRKFELSPKNDAEGQRQYNPTPEYCVMLEDGSLLVMNGVMQRDWLHRVPKEYHDRGMRINLTFRTIHEIRPRPK